ncbi:hypothetical protein QR98_0099430 [Sarcoptes scabiei]|uniref:Uncharacterized protein n=1 Tax=Sarcoptes scabiei TaxID=52283 RepID=A0A132AK44_SARSC|nr:hypothetical protein QR98_0099430 [Sarcoptes scabiei]
MLDDNSTAVASVVFFVAADNYHHHTHNEIVNIDSVGIKNFAQMVSAKTIAERLDFYSSHSDNCQEVLMWTSFDVEEIVEAESIADERMYLMAIYWLIDSYPS